MLPDTFAKYNITFEEAERDSPLFREGIAKFMRDVDETLHWIDQMTRQKRQFYEDFQSTRY
jgi:hypothetical protein